MYIQMRISAESVEKTLSQHSQPDLSSSMTDHLSIKTRAKSEQSFDLHLSARTACKQKSL